MSICKYLGPCSCGLLLTFALATPSLISGAEKKADKSAAATAPADADEEQMLIELRLRALAAEGSEGGNSAAFDEPAMSIAELDALKTLPGKIGPLPLRPDYPADNQPTPARIELGRKLYFDK